LENDYGSTYYSLFLRKMLVNLFFILLTAEVLEAAKPRPNLVKVKKKDVDFSGVLAYFPRCEAVVFASF